MKIFAVPNKSFPGLLLYGLDENMSLFVVDFQLNGWKALLMMTDESPERAGQPTTVAIYQSQSTCRFQLAHHAVLHRPWPNHINTEKIQRLIIYRFLEENGFLVPHRKVLNVVPITKLYSMSCPSAAACGVHA